MLSLAHGLLMLHHGWMGHVARSETERVWSPAKQVLEWRSLPWWRMILAECPRAELRDGVGEGRHASRKQWQDSPESRLEEFYGDWRARAMGRVGWKRSCGDFLRYFVRQWGLPKVPADS